MNILLVFRYFWPEAPHLGDMELAIAEALVEDGHRVLVFASSSTHVGRRYAPKQPRRATIRGVEVVRAWLPEERRGILASRLLNEVLFQSQLATFILRHARRIDALYANTTPPFSSGVIAAIVRKLFGTPYVHHVWDIHPEMDVYAGRLERGWLFKFLRQLDSWICRTSALTVTLSTDMASELESRGNVGKVAVISNFPAGTTMIARGDRSERIGPYVVVFTGNLGKFQGLDAVVRAARLLRDQNVRFDLYGTGSEKGSLQSFADSIGATNVLFHDHVSLREVMDVLSRADLALLPLAPKMHRVAHPSKLPVYLQAGCRVLAVVDSDSDLARSTVASEIGSIAKPGDPVSIAEAVRREISRNSSGELTSTEQFDRPVQLRRWRQAFRSIQRDM